MPSMIATGPQSYQGLMGYDYPAAHNDIKYLFVTFADCQTACSTTTDCIGFIMPSGLQDEDISDCWLKSAFENGQQSSNKDVFVKQDSLVSRKFTRKLARDLVATNTIHEAEMPLGSCAHHCGMVQEDCNAYVLDIGAGKGCWFATVVAEDTDLIENPLKQVFVLVPNKSVKRVVEE